MGNLDTTLFVTVGGPSVLNPIHIKSRLGSEIKYLLKEQGMTIDGVKKMLKKDNSLKLDDFSNKPINVPDNNLKIKLSKISKIIKDLKELK